MSDWRPELESAREQALEGDGSVGIGKRECYGNEDE